jgi:hypothetical protein
MKRYTLREKIAYHNKCANTGKDKNGNELTNAQIVHHAMASGRAAAKLNNFMSMSSSMRDAVVKDSKKKNGR